MEKKLNIVIGRPIPNNATPSLKAHGSVGKSASSPGPRPIKMPATVAITALKWYVILIMLGR
jgi:hypothetical protein